MTILPKFQKDLLFKGFLSESQEVRSVGDVDSENEEDHSFRGSSLESSETSKESIDWSDSNEETLVDDGGDMVSTPKQFVFEIVGDNSNAKCAEIPLQKVEEMVGYCWRESRECFASKGKI